MKIKKLAKWINELLQKKVDNPNIIKIITHHVNTRALITSWNMEMCENWNTWCKTCDIWRCDKDNEIISKIHNVLQKSWLSENQKIKLTKIPTEWFPNKEAVEKINQILSNAS